MSQEVSEWLEQLKLSEYVDLFSREGFDDLEVVTTLSEVDIDQLGIKKLGHKKKLLLAISKLLSKEKLTNSTSSLKDEFTTIVNSNSSGSSSSASSASSSSSSSSSTSTSPGSPNSVTSPISIISPAPSSSVLSTSPPNDNPILDSKQEDSSWDFDTSNGLSGSASSGMPSSSPSTPSSGSSSSKMKNSQGQAASPSSSSPLPSPSSSSTVSPSSSLPQKHKIITVTEDNGSPEDHIGMLLDALSNNTFSACVPLVTSFIKLYQPRDKKKLCQRDPAFNNDSLIKILCDLLGSENHVPHHAQLILATLFVFARQEVNAVRIANEGGIKAVHFTLQSHLCELKVQENGLGVLWNVSVIGENGVRIAQEGGVPVVLKAMQAHPRDRRVQEAGCATLRNLSESEDTKVRLQIADEGGIGAVVSAMQNHPKEAAVQEEGIAALWSLARSCENQEGINTKGGISITIQAMHTHLNDHNVQFMGCGALWTFSLNGDACRLMVASEGGIASILRAMKLHVNEAEVQDNGCGALTSLAFNDICRSLIIATGGLAVAQQAKKMLPSNKKDRAARLLRKLGVH